MVHGMLLTMREDNKMSDSNEEHSELIFLDCLAAKKAPVLIFLMGGIRLQGNLVGSDEFSVLISTENNGDQMIYKHSIATICLDYKRESEKQK
jgi:RNA chaperone Hfq